MSDRAVVSVMGKLKKLQAVLRENGGMRVQLPELLVKPDEAESQRQQTKQKLSELAVARQHAVAAAIEAIKGDASQSSPTPPAAVAGSSSISEVEPAEDEEVGPRKPPHGYCRCCRCQ